MQTKKTILLSLTLTFLGFIFLRLIHIHAIPSVISHDEIYYPTESRSLIMSGHDTSGNWNPLKLTAANPLYAELPGTIMVPAAFIFQNDPLLAARATHIFLGTLILFVIAGVAHKLTKSKTIGFTTLIIAGFNPWFFQFSRMGFDSLFSLFFYFSAIYTTIKFKGNKKLFSLIFWFLGFYQYQGLKIIFIPLVIFTLLFTYLSQTKSLSNDSKQLKKFKVKLLVKKNLSLLLILLATSLIFSSYLLRLNSQEAGGRINDLIFTDKNYTVSNLETQRQQSIETKLTRYVISKPTVIADRFVKQYFDVFNTNQLFVTGESLRNPFSVWKHGIFYSIDVVLILIGIIYMFATKKLRLAAAYLTSLALIAPLPSAINATGTWIMFRASLLFPTLIIFAGVGAFVLYKHLPKIFLYLAVFIYFIFIARFFYQYFYVYPIIGTKDQYFAERVLASYIDRNPEQNIIIYAQEPRFVFESILVYNNTINKENIGEINDAFKNEEYIINNFEVNGSCIPESNDPSITMIAHATVQFCDSDPSEEAQLVDSDSRFTQIPSLIDSGGIYKIYNDQFCFQYGLPRFSHITTNVFNVEKQTDSVFCKSFVIYN